MLAHGGVDALDPQGAEVALLFLAADVIELQRLIDRGIGRGDVVLAAAGKALGLLQDLVAAGGRGEGKGGTGPGFKPPPQTASTLDAPCFPPGQGGHSAAVAGAGPRIVY